MINSSSHDGYFVRNVVLIIVFLTLTPISLATSLFALISLTTSNTSNSKLVSNQISEVRNGARIYAALPNSLPSTSSEIHAEDARTEIIRQYLARYNSPLLSHAKKLVDTADFYHIDFRLTTAIAQQESNLCKIIPENSYNCWGWGITSVSSLGFRSYDEGIEVVTRGLKENYIDQGYITPDKIMTKYTPSSPGTWAMGVNMFMADME